MKLSTQYIAGFVDGEGYLSILKLRRKSARGGIWYQAVIKVSQREKDAKVLEYIQETYGGIMSNRRIYTDNSCPSLTLDIKNRKDIQRMLNDLLPYLIVKKKQAELLLEFLDLPKVKTRKPEKLFTIDDLKEKQSQLYEVARKLNKRGTAATTE